MNNPVHAAPAFPWSAPHARAPVDATVVVPGSKSLTNRALVLAALADGPSSIRRPLHARDTALMVEALRALGTTVGDGGEDWAVTGRSFVSTAVSVDVGNAGTVARFVPPLAALSSARVHLDGDARIRERPLAALIDALRSLGVRIEDEHRAALPFTVVGTGRVQGGAVTVDASASSQLVSGLLLAAPRFDTGVDVRHVGDPLPSAPHIAMTIAMLRRAGADVAVDGDRWQVAPGALHGCDWVIEPDLSNAAPFLAAAVVSGGRVCVPDWPQTTTQPGGQLPALLEQMGATYTLTDAELVVTGSGTIRGLDVDLRACSELVPVLTAIAALATTPSHLRGIGHMRQHETDRLAALATEISALGGDVRESADGLEVRPGPLHGGVVATYDDHRMVMAAAVLGLAVPGVQVADVDTVAKTLPEFTGMWTRMLGEADQPTHDGGGR